MKTCYHLEGSETGKGWASRKPVPLINKKPVKKKKNSNKLDLEKQLSQLSAIQVIKTEITQFPTHGAQSAII